MLVSCEIIYQNILMTEVGSGRKDDTVAFDPETDFVWRKDRVFTWRYLPGDLLQRLLDLGKDVDGFQAITSAALKSANALLHDESRDPNRERLCRKSCTGMCRLMMTPCIVFREVAESYQTGEASSGSVAIGISCYNAKVDNRFSGVNGPAPVNLHKLCFGNVVRPYDGRDWFDDGCYREMENSTLRLVEVLSAEIEGLEGRQTL